MEINFRTKSENRRRFGTFPPRILTFEEGKETLFKNQFRCPAPLMADIAENDGGIEKLSQSSRCDFLFIRESCALPVPALNFPITPHVFHSYFIISMSYSHNIADIVIIFYLDEMRIIPKV